MKSMTSNRELELLGAEMAHEYLEKTGRTNAICFDIEGFIREFLKVQIEYESFAEEDPGKIGFRANGKDPLLVSRNGTILSIVFPKDTIVVEKFLLRDEHSARLRFTLAHEAAHVILDRHIPGQIAACFHSEYDSGYAYEKDDLRRIFSLIEAQADRLAAVLMMPQEIVEKVVRQYYRAGSVTGYEGGIFGQKEKINLQKMADCLGVSYSAFVTRLMELELINIRPVREYIVKGLGFGG